MSCKGLKASARFRDGQKPLYRLKAPVNFLGLPLVSGVSVGEKEELALVVGSGFEVGPSVRFAYRPNDEQMPTSLVVKAGLGPWGSSEGAVVSLAAEFDLGKEGNTRIMLKTSPRFGDFSLRRTPLIEESNSFKKEGDFSRVEFVNKIGKPVNGLENGNGHINGHAGDQLSVMPNGEAIENGISVGANGAENANGPLAGLGWGNRRPPNWGPKPSQGVWTLKVHSSLPVGMWGVATCRWGLTLPRDLFAGGLTGKEIVNAGLPTLVLDKISFEAVKQAKRMRDAVRGRGQGSSRDVARLSDDVISLHAENYSLRKAMDDLRVEFARTGKKSQGRPENLIRGEIFGREEAMLHSQALKDLMQDKAVGVKEKDAFKKAESKKAESKKADSKKADSKKVEVKKGGDSKDVQGLTIPQAGSNDVSAELQKAIMSAQGSG